MTCGGRGKGHTGPTNTRKVCIPLGVYIWQDGKTPMLQASVMARSMQQMPVGKVIARSWTTTILSVL